MVKIFSISMERPTYLLSPQ